MGTGGSSDHSTPGRSDQNTQGRRRALATYMAACIPRPAYCVTTSRSGRVRATAGSIPGLR